MLRDWSRAGPLFHCALFVDPSDVDSHNDMLLASSGYEEWFTKAVDQFDLARKSVTPPQMLDEQWAALEYLAAEPETYCDIYDALRKQETQPFPHRWLCVRVGNRV